MKSDSKKSKSRKAESKKAGSRKAESKQAGSKQAGSEKPKAASKKKASKKSEGKQKPAVNQADLPGTLQRSDDKAQRTYVETLASAEKTYDDDERAAHQVAFAALKHTHEKVGDHWEPKEAYGPSDVQAEGDRTTHRETTGGVDANASKQHLYELATRLEVRGRGRMTKKQLVEALQKANDRASARARQR